MSWRTTIPAVVDALVEGIDATIPTDANLSGCAAAHALADYLEGADDPRAVVLLRQLGHVAAPDCVLDDPGHRAVVLDYGDRVLVRVERCPGLTPCLRAVLVIARSRGRYATATARVTADELRALLAGGAS